MAKQSGLGDNFYLDEYNLSGDVGSLARVGGGPAPGEQTGIDKYAFERIGLVLDGAIDFTSFFNDANVAPHGAFQVLKTRPTADRIGTYCRGTSVGSAAASAVSKQITYDPNRAAGGAFTFTTNLGPNGYGVEWGQLLTAGRQSNTGAATGSGVDFTASTAYGATAYVHVFSFTGTDAYIGVNHSSDNGVGDPFAAVSSGALEHAATGVGAARLSTGTTTTIKRYLQLYVSGTFTQITFAYNLVKYEAPR